jgi:hypothetical protein
VCLYVRILSITEDVLLTDSGKKFFGSNRSRCRLHRIVHTNALAKSDGERAPVRIAKGKITDSDQSEGAKIGVQKLREIKHNRSP